MTAIEVARAALGGVHVFRSRKGEPGQYDTKPYFTGSRHGWVIIDSFTASAITQVYDGLNEVNREKFAGLGLVTMAHVAFKLIKKGNG